MQLTQDIFVFPATEVGGYIVYAPLYRVCFRTNEYTAKQFREALIMDDLDADHRVSKEILQRIAEIRNCEKITPSDGDALFGTDLSVILSQRCNLACTYCYAKDAHSDQVLDFNVLKKCVDFVIDYPVNKTKRFTFIGGGEPTLTWPLLRESIEYIRNRNCEQKVNCSVVTNGTLLTKEKLDFFYKNQVRIVLSFEILKQVQDIQRPLASGRSSFGRVSEALTYIKQSGVTCDCIRSTITNLNVEDMTLMVQQLAENYSFIRYVDLEPVTDKNNTKDFYDRYINNFFEAKRYGESVGITVYNSVSSSLSSVKTRFCRREFCLTPTGEIVCCHRVSSSNDSLFNTFLIGKVTSNSIEIDENKIELLSAIKTNFKECSNCFAKYNCAGGCLSERLGVPQTHEAKCYFTKKMLSLQLEEEMNKHLYHE